MTGLHEPRMAVPATEAAPEDRTRVEVGRAYVSRLRVRAVHHAVVDVGGAWMLRCSGGRAVREYTGWLETAVDCRRCLAAYRAEQEDE